MSSSEHNPQNDQADELSCEPDLLSGEVLDAGDQAVCTGTYVVTQDDINAGKVSGVWAWYVSVEPQKSSRFNVRYCTSVGGARSANRFRPGRWPPLKRG